METFSAGEVLRVALRIICEKYQAVEYRLPRPAYCIIADDSDGHRTRRGFMRYTTANLLTIGDRHWVAALGEKYGQYPAEPFDRDIVAVQLTADAADLNAVMAEMEKVLLKCAWFSDSLIIAMADGTMEFCRYNYFGENRFWIRVANNLPVPFKDLVAEPVQTNPEFIDLSTLGLSVIRPQRYVLDAPLKLAIAIEKTLQES